MVLLRLFPVLRLRLRLRLLALLPLLLRLRLLLRVLCLFLLCRVKVLADLSDGGDVANATEDSLNTLADGFNGGCCRLANCLLNGCDCLSHIWQRGL